MIDYRKELINEYTILESDRFNMLTVEYRIVSWKKREWGKITVLKDKNKITYRYAGVPLIKEIVMLEGDYASQEKLPENMPMWFKELLEKAASYQQSLVAEKQLV